MDRREFIRVTGISGIAFSGLMPLISCSNDDPDFEEQLKKQALLAFKRFEEVWDFNDFWKRGNTFDACLVLASAVNQQWPDDPEVKEKLKAEVDASIAAGVCGAPFFIVDGEPFWGADRIDHLEHWLSTGGW